MYLIFNSFPGRKDFGARQIQKIKKVTSCLSQVILGYFEKGRVEPQKLISYENSLNFFHEIFGNEGEVGLYSLLWPN